MNATRSLRTVFNISRQESFGDKPPKFAASIEPKGGVPNPTGAIVRIEDSLCIFPDSPLDMT